VKNQKKKKRIKKADWRHHVYYGDAIEALGGVDEAQMAGGYRLMVKPELVNGEQFFFWSVGGHGLGLGRNKNTTGMERARITAQRRALAAYTRYIENEHPDW